MTRPRYIVKIIRQDNERSWAYDKVGQTFTGFLVDHHDHFEDRNIWLSDRPDWGWIFEEDGEIVRSVSEPKMTIKSIDPPRLHTPQEVLDSWTDAPNGARTG